MRGIARAAIVCAFALGVSPDAAGGQWAAGAYAGGSRTGRNSLRLSQPGAGTSVVLDEVGYDSRSFDSPIYYGYRVGRFFGGRLGVEGELIHLKVHARTADTVRAIGRVAHAAVDASVPLGAIVERFSISHGLNFLLLNAVLRQPIGGPAARTWLTARGGAGITIPHGESRIAGSYQEQYELGAVGWQGGGGLEIRFVGDVFATAEFKVTTAAPGVSVTGGTIRGRYTSQHVAVGIMWHQR